MAPQINNPTKWFSTLAVILIVFGLVYVFFGLGILPVAKATLPAWSSAIYGAIMIGWGTTLYLLGRLAFRRKDGELMQAILFGLAVWLVAEAIVSAYLSVWFNVVVDFGVLVLFSIPLLNAVNKIK